MEAAPIYWKGAFVRRYQPEAGCMWYFSLWSHLFRNDADGVLQALFRLRASKKL
jgi:hypothetical protein